MFVNRFSILCPFVTCIIFFYLFISFVIHFINGMTHLDELWLQNQNNETLRLTGEKLFQNEWPARSNDHSHTMSYIASDSINDLSKFVKSMPVTKNSLQFSTMSETKIWKPFYWNLSNECVNAHEKKMFVIVCSFYICL